MQLSAEVLRLCQSKRGVCFVLTNLVDQSLFPGRLAYSVGGVVGDVWLALLCMYILNSVVSVSHTMYMDMAVYLSVCVYACMCVCVLNSVLNSHLHWYKPCGQRSPVKTIFSNGISAIRKHTWTVHALARYLIFIPLHFTHACCWFVNSSLWQTVHYQLRLSVQGKEFPPTMPPHY